MEFDPETNTYTSHGPLARQRDAETDIARLKRRVSDLEKRVDRLERQMKTRD